MLQHFLATQVGSGRRLVGGAVDAFRPAGVDALPAGTAWQNYTYGPDGVCLVRVDAPAVVLQAYAALPDVLPFPRDLTELVQSSQLGRIQTVCDGYRIPRFWVSAGLQWEQVLRRMFRVFSLAQRLRGVSKIGLAAHLSGGEALTTQWRDLPPALRQGLLAAADSFGGLAGGMDRSGIGASSTLGEILYEVGRGWQREPWEADPPLPPGTITDDFNRGSLGANWTNGPGNLSDAAIVSNAFGGTGTGVDVGAYYSAASWNNDQTSEATLTIEPGSPANQYPNVRVRTASDGDGYIVETFNNNSSVGFYSFYRIDNGDTFTSIGADEVTTTAYAAGVAVKGGMVGTTLTYYRNGASVDTRTDATYASGSPGLGVYRDTGAGATGIWDGWSGTGEVVVGGGMAFMGARKNRSARARALN